MNVTRRMAPAVALQDRPEDVDEWVRMTVQWHFSPDTGSPFWLSRAAHLPFDPLTDITTRADLQRFPDLSGELSSVPVEELLPRGRMEGPRVRVFESGGTTGAPKRIVETSSRAEALGWVSSVLDQHAGFPGRGEGHWLHIGPSGPHIVGRSIGLLAELRGAVCFYIDFDPRWVKRLVLENRGDEVARYVDHLIDESLTVLRTQRVSVVFATPPVLERICLRSSALSVFRDRVRGLVWSGTSVSAETLRLVEELFGGAAVVGLYGNSLMGIAPQRPRLRSDDERCVFQPLCPQALVHVVDPTDVDRVVDYGERGRVRISLLTHDLFLPNVLERDGARRVSPVPGFPWDGVADVSPLRTTSQEPIAEGVY